MSNEHEPAGSPTEAAEKAETHNATNGEFIRHYSGLTTEHKCELVRSITEKAFDEDCGGDWDNARRLLPGEAIPPPAPEDLGKPQVFLIPRYERNRRGKLIVNDSEMQVIVRMNNDTEAIGNTILHTTVGVNKDGTPRLAMGGIHIVSTEAEYNDLANEGYYKKKGHMRGALRTPERGAGWGTKGYQETQEAVLRKQLLTGVVTTKQFNRRFKQLNEGKSLYDIRKTQDSYRRDEGTPEERNQYRESQMEHKKLLEEVYGKRYEEIVTTRNNKENEAIKETEEKLEEEKGKKEAASTQEVVAALMEEFRKTLMEEVRVIVAEFASKRNGVTREELDATLENFARMMGTNSGEMRQAISALTEAVGGLVTIVEGQNAPAGEQETGAGDNVIEGEWRPATDEEEAGIKAGTGEEKPETVDGEFREIDKEEEEEVTEKTPMGEYSEAAESAIALLENTEATDDDRRFEAADMLEYLYNSYDDIASDAEAAVRTIQLMEVIEQVEQTGNIYSEVARDIIRRATELRNNPLDDDELNQLQTQIINLQVSDAEREAIMQHITYSNHIGLRNLANQGGENE